MWRNRLFSKNFFGFFHQDCAQYNSYIRVMILETRKVHLSLLCSSLIIEFLEIVPSYWNYLRYSCNFMQFIVKTKPYFFFWELVQHTSCIRIHYYLNCWYMVYFCTHEGFYWNDGLPFEGFFWLNLLIFFLFVFNYDSWLDPKFI